MWPFTARTKKPPVTGANAPAANAIHLPTKIPAKHETFADRLDWVCKKHNGTYAIVRKNGQVVVQLIMDEGHSVMSGKGATTAEAAAALLRNVEAVL